MEEMADARGLEPPAAGLKGLCPADPGWLCFASVGRRIPAASRADLSDVIMFVSIAMVHQSGIEPASIAYQAIALPLSYRCVDGASCWVRSSGLGHLTAALCQLS